jgi:hypothetical protein
VPRPAATINAAARKGAVLEGLSDMTQVIGGFLARHNRGQQVD